MIYSVRGQLLAKSTDSAVVEAAGVGYLVTCGSRQLERLPPIGSEVFVLTHLLHREDSMQLYGFESTEDRELFLTLVQVSGVGASKALALVGTLGAQEAIAAILAGNPRRLAQAPGIGLKLAQRLIIELKDKLTGRRAPAQEDVEPVPTTLGEAELALLGLGYTPLEARRALAGLGQETSVDDAIKHALKVLAASQ